MISSLILVQYVRGLKISHLNTRSILPEIGTQRLEMKDKPFDIFSASESRLKPNISDSEIGLPGYSIIRMDRENKVGGGNAIYVRDGIPFKTHSELMCKDLENCMIEISRAKSKNCLFFVFTEHQIIHLKTF